MVVNLPAATLSVTPSSVSAQYTGFLSLQVGGLAPGQAVLVEKYLDANGNGVIDAGEFAMQRFRLVDGITSQIAGVPNVNIPADTDGSNGVINAVINFANSTELSPIAGQYLFRLSDPLGIFPALTNLFTVTNVPAAQAFVGTVQSGGTNVPNAVVIALVPNPSGGVSLVAGTVADASGNYNLPLPPGGYVLVPSHPGYVASLGGPPAVLGAGGVTTANLNLLAGTNTLSGQLVDAASPGKGIPGIFLLLQSSGGLLTLTFTDLSGNYSAAVATDGWQIQPGQHESAAHGYLVPNSNVQTNVPAGGLAGVTVALPRASALLYGSIKDLGGNPVPGVALTANDQSGIASDQHTTSDPNGNYALAASASATWGLNLDLANPALTNQVTQPGFLITNFSVGPAAQQNFVLQTATNRISGHVRDNQGRPIAGVYVFATDAAQFQAWGPNTDTNGYYSLAVGTGPYTVVPNCNGGSSGLTALGFSCVPSVTTNVTSGAITLDFTIPPAVAPTTHLRGRAVDDAGLAVTNLNLFAGNSNGVPQFQATTDGDGNFDLGVIGGAYQLSLNSDLMSGLPARGLLGPVLPLSVTDGLDINGLQLVARRFTGAIQVAVRTAASNAPVPGLGVSARQTFAGTNYFTPMTTTGSAGTALLPVFDGQWAVYLNNQQVAADGFSTNTGGQTNTIAHNTNQVTFLLQACGSPIITVANQIPDALAGAYYTFQFSAASCYSPLAWSVSPGSGPPPGGLNLLPSGQLSGYPGTPGNYTFSVRVSDGHTNADLSVALRVNSPVQVATTSLPNPVLGMLYSVPLQAINGLLPYQWSLSPSSAPLPPGLTLATNGLLAGTPTLVGSYFFSVRVTDAGSHFLDQALGCFVLNTSIRPQITVLPQGPDGSFHCQFPAVAGQNYALQVSSDLRAWSNLMVTNSPPGGLLQLSDPAAPSVRRFYRLLIGP